MRKINFNELREVSAGDNATLLIQHVLVGVVVCSVSALFLLDDWVEDDLLNLVIDYIGISAGIVGGVYGGIYVFDHF